MAAAAPLGARRRLTSRPMTDELRAIVDANLYMVLGTADEAGRPWVSPVYFAHTAYREFLWVSKPDTTHSRNIEARPDVSIVVFDSSVPISTGRGVYMRAAARQVTGDERAEAIDVFSHRSLAHGGREWTVEDVESRLRLYRALATEHYLLDEHDFRVPVNV
jgi:nitroimidazol reductase NimA-like FMN-containing flavoprotein (pyridoxamine 5'-phosphate oxidase superfamily)